MPQWYFFAFNSKKTAEVLLQPAQDALENGDVALWQKVYDLLNKSHYPPTEGGFAWEGTIIQNFDASGSLSRDKIPDRSSAVLRRCLQTFVELSSRYRLSSYYTRIRAQVVGVIPWEKILHSQEELAEMQLFKTEIVAHEKHPVDPFWCLAANDACDANYVAPEVVATIAEAEARIGLFRSLVRRPDLDKDVVFVAKELAAASLLIELAAIQGLALYFREDAT